VGNDIVEKNLPDLHSLVVGHTESVERDQSLCSTEMAGMSISDGTNLVL
jgi:hypothetical protein